MAGADRIEGVGWIRLLAGFALLFAVLQGTAGALQSLRGEAGLLVAAAVLLAAIGLQRLLFVSTWREAVARLGLHAPAWRGLSVAVVLCALLLGVIPAYLALKPSLVTSLPNPAWLALGVLLQAGVAEELVFRGYLFGNIRRGRPFWRAAFLATLPFAAAHLYLFWTMDWPVALSALILSVAVSFPFAWLYELGGGTIWAPALAHAVVQGGVKLVVVHDAYFVIVWMLASAVLLWLVFFVSSSSGSRS